MTFLGLSYQLLHFVAIIHTLGGFIVLAQGSSPNPVDLNGAELGLLRPAVSIYHNRAKVWLGDMQHFIFPNTRVFEGENSSISLHPNGTGEGILLLKGEPIWFKIPREVLKGNSTKLFIPKVELSGRRLSQRGIGGCKTKDPVTSNRRLSSALSDSVQRVLNGVTRWTDCYRDEGTTRYLDIGVVADCSFYQHHGGSLQAVLHEIETYVSRSNLVLANQLNIRLRIKQIFVLPCEGPGSLLPFNLCRQTIEEDLQSFSEWSGGLKFDGDPQSEIVQQGLWHLLTACHQSPGNIGIAYLQQTSDASRFGTVCEHGKTAINVGVTSVKSGTPWLTFIHEIGHNLGARHSTEDGTGSTGGIMDTGSSGVYNGVIQFNPYRKAEICHELDYSIHSGICEYSLEGKVFSFYTAFHPDCSNMESTASCGSSDNVCENGLCVSPHFDLRINQISVASKQLNSINFESRLSARLEFAVDPVSCTRPDLQNKPKPFLLVDLVQRCDSLDYCALASASGAVGLLVTDLSCSAVNTLPSIRVMLLTCATVPVLYIDPTIGCQLGAKLQESEAVTVALVESPSTTIIADFVYTSIASGSGAPSQSSAPTYPGIVLASVVVCFVLFGAIVVWFRNFVKPGRADRSVQLVI